MNWLLNSSITNYLLKLAFSKSGVIVRWLVGYIVGAVAGLNIIPNGDVDTISFGLTQGLTAAVAILYALLNYWLNQRHATAVNVVKEMLNKATDAGPTLLLDGVMGNNTILKMSEVTNVDPKAVIKFVRS